MRYIDLTHTLTDSLPVYPGDLPPKLTALKTVDRDGVGQFELSTTLHAGTHIDAPLHMISEGKKMSNFLIENFLGRGVLINAIGYLSIGVELLEGVDIRPGDAVIVNTGWHNKFGSNEYFVGYPFVSAEFAQRLVEAKASMLGLDTAGPDDEPFEVHKILLRHDILIIENLANTELLVGLKSFEIIALPLKIAADASLARVIARVDPKLEGM